MRRGGICRTENNGSLSRFVDIGMLEEAKSKLDTQNATHGFVDRRLRPLAVPQKIGTVLVEIAADHFHVHAGIEGQPRGFFFIRSQAVIDQFLNGGVIADHEAVELPFAAQDMRQRERIRRSRHAIETVEGAHQRTDP